MISQPPEVELAVGFVNGNKFHVKLSENKNDTKIIDYFDTRFPAPVLIPSKEMMFLFARFVRHG